MVRLLTRLLLLVASLLTSPRYYLRHIRAEHRLHVLQYVLRVVRPQYPVMSLAGIPRVVHRLIPLYIPARHLPVSLSLVPLVSPVYVLVASLAVLQVLLRPYVLLLVHPQLHQANPQLCRLGSHHVSLLRVLVVSQAPSLVLNRVDIHQVSLLYVLLVYRRLLLVRIRQVNLVLVHQSHLPVSLLGSLVYGPVVFRHPNLLAPLQEYLSRCHQDDRVANHH